MQIHIRNARPGEVTQKIDQIVAVLLRDDATACGEKLKKAAPRASPRQLDFQHRWSRDAHALATRAIDAHVERMLTRLAGSPHA